MFLLHFILNQTFSFYLYLTLTVIYGYEAKTHLISE